jgi:hypothetical protein
MARAKVIDLDTYSKLDQYCIGLNEFYKSLRRAGFDASTALAIILEPATYPATILPAPNWLPNLPEYYDEDEDE